MTFVYITAILAVVFAVFGAIFAAAEKDLTSTFLFFSCCLNLFLSIAGYLCIKFWLWVTTYVTIAITFNG